MTAPRVLFAGGGTGGHLYPALALADALRRMEPDAEVFFVGARRGVEARVLPERGEPHELLPFEPLRRARPWENWRLAVGLPMSVLGLERVFRRFRPDVVVGTGGYASGPAVLWGILRGIPTAVQEQNSYPGVTTRWLSGRVRQIHLAFPEAAGYLRPGKRTEVYEFGNPIQPPNLSLDRSEARRAFGLGDGTVALVVGGSQGARAVNEALLADLEGIETGSLPPRPPDLQILWATGPANHAEVSGRLEALNVDWVRAVPYITDMPRALAAADIAVSRAGAMALAELCAWGVPSILVPFPHAAANHQFHNARALATSDAAVLLEERRLQPGALWSELRALASDAERRERLAEAALGRGRPDAAERIVERLMELSGG
jgi:UDP-N-acetylglucosamine--N-acetylmuramyl-(pentapeptide) pyrophosphoryl-undecaprenol N-acetylglucosamine transferase